ITGRWYRALTAEHTAKPLPSEREMSSRMRSNCSCSSRSRAAAWPDAQPTRKPSPSRYSVRLSTMCLSSSTKRMDCIVSPAFFVIIPYMNAFFQGERCQEYQEGFLFSNFSGECPHLGGDAPLGPISQR